MPNRFECLIDEAEINESVQPEQLKQYPHGPIQSENQSNQLPTPAEQESEPMPRGEEQNQCINSSIPQIERTNPPIAQGTQNSNRPGNQNTIPCVVLIGDSIIKNIIPQKLSQKKVH